MINRSLILVLLALGTPAAHAQHIIHRVPPMTPEQAAEGHRRDQVYADAWKTTVRARKLVDKNDPRAEFAFDEAARLYASVPDPSSEAEVQAEWAFQSGDYPAVARITLRDRLRELDDNTKLQIAIAECRTGHPERALPRLAYWRAQEYWGTGDILEADLPVEAGVSAQSVEATAWLILAFHRKQAGRPALAGLLEAQRLAPTNPAIAIQLVGVGFVSGDYALARRNLPLTKASKSPIYREDEYRRRMAANIAYREARARAASAAKAPR